MIPWKSFDPKHVPGLSLWYDASDASTVTLGQGVRGLSDKSGNARHASQLASNSQPELTANAIDGKPALVFDGLNDSLTFPILNLSAWTAFAVCERTGSGNATILQVMQAAFGVESLLFQVNDSATDGPVLVGSGSTGAAKYGKGGTLGANTPRVLSAKWAGAGTNGATYYNSWANGTQITLADSGAAHKASGNDSRIGAAWCNGALQAFWRGKVGEILVYSSALSDDLRTAVERHLARKWGL